jgi:hypothetical protein
MDVREIVDGSCVSLTLIASTLDSVRSCCTRCTMHIQPGCSVFSSTGASACTFSLLIMVAYVAFMDVDRRCLAGCGVLWYERTLCQHPESGQCFISLQAAHVRL